MPKSLWDDATTATKRELRLASAEAVLRSSRSACIELPVRSRVSVAGVAGIIVFLLVLGLLLLLAAIVLVVAIWLGRMGTWQQAWTQPFVAFAAGIAAVALSLGQEKRCFRRIAPIAAQEFDILPREPIGIEPADTYRKFKILPDDLGILHHDVAGRRLLVMTTTHCCCVCAPDVVSLRKGEGGIGSGVQLDVRFGATILPVVFSARENLFDSRAGHITYDAKAYFLQRLDDTLSGVCQGVEGYRDVNDEDDENDDCDDQECDDDEDDDAADDDFDVGKGRPRR